MEKKGLGIIFHSGSYDRIHHGFSIALAALALGRETKLFFSYWALEYLKKEGPPKLKLDSEAEEAKKMIEKNRKRGHLQGVGELIAQAKAMGGKLFVCTHSMGILNIARDEFIGEVDKSMGLTTFLAETADYQLMFV